MSDIIDPEKVANDAFVQKVFTLLKDPCMRGICPKAREQLDRIIEIAKNVVDDEPYEFIQRLHRAIPISYQMGNAHSRIGKIQMAAELYLKKTNAKRDRLRDTIKEQQNLIGE